MRRVSQSTYRKYKSPAFHNVGDLNQLNPLKIISLGFACKGNKKISTLQASSKKKPARQQALRNFTITPDLLSGRNFCKDTKEKRHIQTYIQIFLGIFNYLT